MHLVICMHVRPPCNRKEKEKKSLYEADEFIAPVSFLIVTLQSNPKVPLSVLPTRSIFTRGIFTKRIYWCWILRMWLLQAMDILLSEKKSYGHIVLWRRVAVLDERRELVPGVKVWHGNDDKNVVERVVGFTPRTHCRSDGIVDVGFCKMKISVA